MSVRYNETTDSIQCYYNGVWIDVFNAKIKWDGIIYKNGLFAEKYFDKTYSINQKSYINPETSFFFILNTDNILIYARADKRQQINGSIIICFNKQEIRINGKRSLNIRGSGFYSYSYVLLGIGLATRNDITSIENIPYKISKSITNIVDASFDLTEFPDNQPYYLYVFLSGGISGGNDYAVPAGITITEISLS